MKIQYCSDLHLEFDLNTMYLSHQPLRPVADILILAGDISYLREDAYKHRFFDYVSRHWKQVFWIPGNHEYYCGIDVLSYDFSEPIKVRKNVFIVDKYSLIIKDVHLIFSTLWSKIDATNRFHIEQHVSDFHRIIYNKQKLNAKTFNHLHKQSLNFIKKELSQSSTKYKVVVSHHVPSEKCTHPDFKGSKINSAFTVDLTKFIETCSADYWIYGHSHRNLEEITIGKTKILTNQLGYIQMDEQNSFRADAFIEL